MRTKVLLAIFTICLSVTLSSCANGPKVTVYTSKPGLGGFSLYDQTSGTAGFVTYAASGQLKGFPEPDAQAMLSYCESRQSISPARFTTLNICDNDPINGGMKCRAMTCGNNSDGIGELCSGSAESFFPYASTENFIAFTPTDQQTLFEYCDIAIQ